MTSWLSVIRSFVFALAICATSPTAGDLQDDVRSVIREIEAEPYDLLARVSTFADLLPESSSGRPLIDAATASGLSTKLDVGTASLASLSSDCLGIKSQVHRPGGEQLNFRFAVASDVSPALAAAWRAAVATLARGWTESEVGKAESGINPDLVLTHQPFVEPRRASNQYRSAIAAQARRSVPLFVVARRQQQLAALDSFLSPMGCGGPEMWSLGLAQPAYDMGRADHCASLFSTYRDEDEANSPWLLKPYIHLSGGNRGGYGSSTQLRPVTRVLRGLRELRRHYGECHADGGGSGSSAFPRDAVLQPALREPLLVHSRRCKLHAYLLVVSTSPWVAMWYPGVVTLAASRADTSVYSGAAVPDDAALARESTRLNSRGGLMRAPGSTASLMKLPQVGGDKSSVRLQRQQADLLWDFERLARYAESYGLCESPTPSGNESDNAECGILRRRLRAAVLFASEATRSAAEPSAGSFALFELSFFLTGNLEVLFDKGSVELESLLPSNIDADKWQERLASDLLAGALDVVTAVQEVPTTDPRIAALRVGSYIGGKSQVWQVLSYEPQEKCGSETAVHLPRFDACGNDGRFNPKGARGGSQWQQDDRGSGGDPHDKADDDEAVLSFGAGAGEGLYVAPGTVLTSPKVPLPLERRELKSPDQPVS